MEKSARSVLPTLLIGLLAMPMAMLLGLAIQTFVLTVMEVAQEDGGVAVQAFFSESIEGFFCAILISQLSFLAIWAAAMTREREPWAHRLGLSRVEPRRWSGGLLVSMVFATFAVTILAGLLSMPFLPEENSYQESLAGGIGLASGAWIPALIFGMAILPALVEEILFRGYFLRGLLRGLSPTWALWISALVFAFAHPNLYYAVRLVPLAFWLGWITYRTGSIIPSIVCHFVNNTFGVCATLLAPSPSEAAALQAESEAVEVSPWMGILVSLFFVFLLFCVLSLRKVYVRLRELPPPSVDPVDEAPLVPPSDRAPLPRTAPGTS